MKNIKRIGIFCENDIWHVSNKVPTMERTDLSDLYDEQQFVLDLMINEIPLVIKGMICQPVCRYYPDENCIDIIYVSQYPLESGGKLILAEMKKDVSLEKKFFDEALSRVEEYKDHTIGSLLDFIETKRGYVAKNGAERILQWVDNYDREKNFSDLFKAKALVCALIKCGPVEQDICAWIKEPLTVGGIGFTVVDEDERTVNKAMLWINDKKAFVTNYEEADANCKRSCDDYEVTKLKNRAVRTNYTIDEVVSKFNGNMQSFYKCLIDKVILNKNILTIRTGTGIKKDTLLIKIKTSGRTILILKVNGMIEVPGNLYTQNLPVTRKTKRIMYEKINKLLPFNEYQFIENGFKANINVQSIDKTELNSFVDILLEFANNVEK